MAYTKKTASTEAKAEVVEQISEVAKQNENEVLKKQLEDMKNQMAVLMAQVAGGNTVSPISKKERNITFINLTPGEFIMKGSQIWKISEQFGTKTFLEREARMIVNNMQNSIRSGNIYIADNDFIQENELEEIYRNLLDDVTLKNLLNQHFSIVIDAYKNASPAQREIIIDMVRVKRLNGESVDANILVELGKLCNQDLMNLEPLDETEG